MAVRTGVDLTTELSPFLPAPGPTPQELAALRTWLPGKRWFPVKTGLESIDPWLSVKFADGSDTVIHLLRAHGASGSALVHVPVLRRPSSGHNPDQAAPDVGTAPVAPAGFIGNVDTDELIDAFHLEQYWQSWLTLAQWGEDDDAEVPSLDLTGATFISGEQSNSSIIFPNVADGAILKVFRGLAEGPNPDVDVPRALVQTGWDGVPRPLAWLELTWSEHNTGLIDLGVLSEFVAGASDGFQLACAYAAGNQSFSTEAHQLGQTIAQMHQALVTALPTEQHMSMEWLRTELRRRARNAITTYPVLAARAGAVETLLGRIGQSNPAPNSPSADDGATTEGDLPEALVTLQHIHGDLHLGQALFSESTGWRILDFEGEPMRPVSERLRPDLPVRDVAGVLRSFDYAAAVGETTDVNWVADAREAFLAGYLSEQPTQFSSELLQALELDKALYEVGYESANRPDWVAIPLAGVDRILAEQNAH